jgi:hypothetical protein
MNVAVLHVTRNAQKQKETVTWHGGSAQLGPRTSLVRFAQDGPQENF